MNTKRLIVLAAIETVAIALGVLLLLFAFRYTSNLDAHTGAKQDVESREKGLIVTKYSQATSRAGRPRARRFI